MVVAPGIVVGEVDVVVVGAMVVDVVVVGSVVDVVDPVVVLVVVDGTVVDVVDVLVGTEEVVVVGTEWAPPTTCSVRPPATTWSVQYSGSAFAKPAVTRSTTYTFPVGVNATWSPWEPAQTLAPSAKGSVVCMQICTSVTGSTASTVNVIAASVRRYDTTPCTAGFCPSGSSRTQTPELFNPMHWPWNT